MGAGHTELPIALESPPGRTEHDESLGDAESKTALVIPPKPSPKISGKESAFWASIKGSSDRDDYVLYLELFASGAHVENAKAMLASLPEAEEEEEEAAFGTGAWMGTYFPG